MLRRALQQAYQTRLHRLVAASNQADLSAPALVFAPHQDDETLGCGGTILKKTRAGAQVAVVFMTDGRTSHQHLMEPGVLTALRRAEAQAACLRLGVPERSVFFLDFADGRLSEQQAAAGARVTALLHQLQPRAVYLPYFRDAQPDHLATNAIVRNALENYDQAVTVYEYPVWFWYHWPWVTWRQGSRKGLKAVTRNTVLARFGWRLVKEFNHAVYTGDVLPEKKAALAEHRSQMERLVPDPSWATLVEFSNGEFLARFFQEQEVFLCYRLRQQKERRPQGGKS